MHVDLDAEIKRLIETETAAKKRERLLRKELGALREDGTATKALLRDREEQCRTLTGERDHLSARLSEALEKVLPEQKAYYAALMRDMELMKEANQALVTRLKETNREYNLAMRAMKAELRTANEKEQSLAAEVERFSSEKRAWEFMSATFKKKVRNAVERLRKEKQVLVEELQRLREQVDERLLPSSPVKHEATEPVIPHSLVMAEADAESPRAAASYAMGASLGRTGSAFKSGGSVFRHDPKLTTITCHSPDEVIEIHGAINAIQAGPFGRIPQVCRAYVLGVRHGRKMSVYLAWLLQDERAVLVCRPEKQPDNAAGYAAMMRDAIFYFESTGFMMDHLDLSMGRKRQLTALEESGICRFGASLASRATTG